MQKNENRAGYKKTKVGWIPEDWECLPFTDVFDRVVVPLAPIETETYQEIGVRSHGKGIFHKEPVTGADIGSKRVFHCQPGALVFNIVFAWEQAVAVLSEQERGLIASHRFPMYKGKEGQAFEPFFLYFFKTRKGKNGLGIASPGGAGRNKTLGQKDMEYLYVPKPTRSEQVMIAGVLECWHRGIRNLELKIVKKRNIKKGLMQRLLSGKQRLPGFEGEWKDVRLGEVCSMKSGETITSKSIYDKAEYRCFGGNGLRGFTTTFTHDGAFVLIGRQGALCGNVHLVSGRFYASEHAIVATPSEGTNPLWFAESLRFMNLNRHTESSAQPGLSVSKILRMNIAAPPPSEQQAIASVLSASDEEIADLERKLVVLKEQKRFLLNNLVTGTIRLPEFVGAAQTADTKGDTE